ncbi:MAG: ABC transporter permease [Lachnospiraceae bacterium]|nr:ABC transporter permease [Lachnospiraceae bacterium]
MKRKESIFKNAGFQSILAAVICVVIGIFVGYLVLLAINPAGASEGIVTIMKNYFNYPTKPAAMKYLGNTLVKTAPLLLCALSINFCYKVGLFNIGAAGQYVVGAGACLYAALALKLPWIVCLVLAVLAGAIWGMFVGFLKAYGNVNEVISGIMLNWIGLYSVNMLLAKVKEPTSPYTFNLAATNAAAVLPTLGMEKYFSNNRYVTIAIPLSVIIAVVIWVILTKTKFGYELQATGFNKDASKYAGMNEKRNIILTLMIGGALAGMGAALLYLTGFEQWSTTQSSVPAMGFNGIAATFLGGLHPIGTVFASYFIQHITSGGAYLDKAIYPSQISDLISAIIIYLCGFVLFFKFMLNRRIDAGAEKKAQAEKLRAEKAAEGKTETETGKPEGGDVV